MVPKSVVDATASRYSPHKYAAMQERLKAGPLAADSPERVEKRIRHLSVSEMARATSLAPERAAFAGSPIAAAPATVNVLERVIGRNDLMSVTFLDLALRVSRTVGRVRIRNAAGQLVGYGTGFLIAPRVLITNNHVLGSAAEAANSQVEFNYQDQISGAPAVSTVFGLGPNNLFMTDPALDYTVVAVNGTSGDTALTTFGFNQLIEQEGKVLVGEYLNVIQHPNGEPKQIALRENQLIEVLQQFLHYHTDTAPGSSGSPVFNDQWEVVALHHSGVPRTDSQGRYLTKDGTLWTPAMGEHRIDWIANEGARVSRITAHLKNGMAGLNATARKLVDSIFSVQSPLSALPELGKARAAETPSAGSSAPTISRDGIVTWTLPVQISVKIGNQDALALTDSIPQTTQPAAVDSIATAGDAFLEKAVVPAIDTHYSNRKGYNESFLGTAIPLPKVTKTAVLAKMEDGEHVIPYQHFSIVMHKHRRLALLTASNIDGRKRSKEPEPGRDYTRKGLGGLGKNDSEKWTTDPRIPEAHQLPDVFFTKDRQSFDKGHIVRREDVCFGRTYATVQRANGDTFHTTNCSPQVKGFNQAGEDGLWGKLENFIMDQAKTEAYTLFAGPLFSDDDEIFEGVDERGPTTVQIPSRFWKIVVANGDAGLQAFAFILDQDLSSVRFREEFAVTAEWAEHAVSITDLEQALEIVQFPKVLKDADQFGSPISGEIVRAARLERQTVRGIRSAA